MLIDPYAAYGQQGETRRVNDLPRICADIRDRFPCRVSHGRLA